MTEVKGDPDPAASLARQSASLVNLPLPELTSDQRKALREWRFGRKVEPRLWLRASIIWELLHHRSSVARVAACVGVTERTVCKWRDRFLEAGVKGLYDRPRSGRPPRFGPGQHWEVIALACDAPAQYGFEGQTLWTYDTLTDAVRRRLGLPMSRSTSGGPWSKTPCGRTGCACGCTAPTPTSSRR